MSNAQEDAVKEKILNCLNLDAPKSFFLFAGAGSGKTRTLVEILEILRETQIPSLRLKGKRVAVITYTVAATDEIKRRLQYDDSFEVSTIHSFCWSLIGSFTHDIRGWLKANLTDEIEKLEEQQKKGRASKASDERVRKINSKNNRLASLNHITKFTYSPSGTNADRDSLNHSEVIKIAASFLRSEPLMQKVLVGAFPYLIIDESQDTQKELLNALLEVQSKNQERFSLGLIGDTMQRIYSDGEPSLGRPAPTGWETPEKQNNYRSPRRVVDLINKVRAEHDDREQLPERAEEGLIRLFIVDQSIAEDKQTIEKLIAKQMADDTNDDNWTDLRKNVKTLVLEHHLAAARDGFLDFFAPLYKEKKTKDGLLDGKLKGLELFTKIILPLIDAYQHDDAFTIANILKAESPFLEKTNLETEQSILKLLMSAKTASESLFSLMDNHADPTLQAILENVATSKLLFVPEMLEALSTNINDASSEIMGLGELDEFLDIHDLTNSLQKAWRQALKAPFSQLRSYDRYINDKSSFGTHQGVKGLEFDRVMVILDDDEARGFLFNYERFLGAEALSAKDLENINNGVESSQDRTRRLFYVICSRAQESLAVVAYTKNPSALKQHILANKWFAESEIVDFADIKTQ